MITCRMENKPLNIDTGNNNFKNVPSYTNFSECSEQEQHLNHSATGSNQQQQLHQLTQQQQQQQHNQVYNSMQQVHSHVANVNENQQCWYGYPNSISSSVSAGIYHQPSQVASQQFFNHSNMILPWGHYPSHYPYPQYQQQYQSNFQAQSQQCSHPFITRRVLEMRQNFDQRLPQISHYPSQQSQENLASERHVQQNPSVEVKPRHHSPLDEQAQQYSPTNHLQQLSLRNMAYIPYSSPQHNLLIQNSENLSPQQHLQHYPSPHQHNLPSQQQQQQQQQQQHQQQQPQQHFHLDRNIMERIEIIENVTLKTENHADQIINNNMSGNINGNVDRINHNNQSDDIRCDNSSTPIENFNGLSTCNNMDCSNGANVPSTSDNLTSSSNISGNESTKDRSLQKSPYEWMKKSSYQNQPACNATVASNVHSSSPINELCYRLETLGKTRTKDKYRVVYLDYQKKQLEEEFRINQYITIKRKTELARELDLSERQVKIWFQNRRAKARREIKRNEEERQRRMEEAATETVVTEAATNFTGGAEGMGGILGGLLHTNDNTPSMQVINSAVANVPILPATNQPHQNIYMSLSTPHPSGLIEEVRFQSRVPSGTPPVPCPHIAASADRKVATSPQGALELTTRSMSDPHSSLSSLGNRHFFPDAELVCKDKRNNLVLSCDTV